MSSFMTFLSLVAMIAVAAVLVLGLLNLMRGGPANRSQKLMRMRVLLQALAIVVIVAALWFAQ